MPAVDGVFISKYAVAPSPCNNYVRLLGGFRYQMWLNANCGNVARAAIILVVVS